MVKFFIKSLKTIENEKLGIRTLEFGSNLWYNKVVHYNWYVLSRVYVAV